jgi:hypothetical protein
VHRFTVIHSVQAVSPGCQAWSQLEVRCSRDPECITGQTAFDTVAGRRDSMWGDSSEVGSHAFVRLSSRAVRQASSSGAPSPRVVSEPRLPLAHSDLVLKGLSAEADG